MTETYTHDPVAWVIETQAADYRAGKLSIWTVFDHPKDFPHHYVARRFVADKKGPQATEKVIVTLSLDALRLILQSAGLTVMMRAKSDDPRIVESWL